MAALANFSITVTRGIASVERISVTGELRAADGKPILFRRGGPAIEIHARLRKPRHPWRTEAEDPIKWYV